MMPARTIYLCILGLLLFTSTSFAKGPTLLAPLSDGSHVALPEASRELPHPTSFLGHTLGERFVPHHRIVTYMERLADASPRVSLVEYGRSYEDRPLLLLTITSTESSQRLEELREGNLRLADRRGYADEELESLLASQPAVVWLAYGVHGNESSSPMAALAAAYTLASAEGELANLLQRTVVHIDPAVNPDGYMRYVHGYQTRRGMRPDPQPLGSEHREPWPGGRQNHYLIDLNRDWSWASQVETRQRIAAYRRWEPQVYVDFHEMGSDSSYFFPPAAEPIHPQIGPEVLAWLQVFGRGNATAFDRHGWPFYVREIFDLFYPGYGDTYPGLRGAVGMTYEMAGGGFAGRSLQLEDGRKLELADRIARHLTTSLATVRTAATHQRKLLTDFARSRARSLEEPVRTYLWSANQAEAASLVELLQLHGLEVRQLAAARGLQVRMLEDDTLSTTRQLEAGTLAVSTDQPLGNLLRTLMEPQSEISPAFLDEQRRRIESHQGTEFYDITGWSLPMAFNLQAWISDQPLSGLRPAAPAEVAIRGQGDVGFLVPPAGLGFYALAAALLREGIVFRWALEGFQLGERDFPAGTLFVPRHGNPENVGSRLEEHLQEARLPAFRASTSYTESGPSLGSDRLPVVRKPRIGLTGGRGISPTSFGSLWYLLDRQIGLPYHRLDAGDLGRDELAKLDVLVLPSGSYEEIFSESAAEAIEAWVRGGGVLIAVADAVEWLQEKKLTAILSWSPPEVPEPNPLGEDNAGLENRELFTPGAILATDLNRRHDLSSALASPPPALFFGTTMLMPTGNPAVDVLRVRESRPVLGGFAWPEAAERLRGKLLVSDERVGQGRLIVFSQEPAFRLFWRGTAPLFLNAVLLTPSL